MGQRRERSRRGIRKQEMGLGAEQMGMGDGAGDRGQRMGWVMEVAEVSLWDPEVGLGAAEKPVKGERRGLSKEEENSPPSQPAGTC